MSRTHAAPRSGAIISVLAAAGITVSLMQTLIVPLIATLPTLLHTTTANAFWAITATLLAGAVAMPVSGRLGDLYGKRRVMVVSALLLAAGSLVCAPANSLTPMVIGRTLQGLGLGVIPLGIAIMRDVLPPQRLGSAIGLMSSSLGVGGALGLPAAALVAQYVSWHALFWGAAGLGLVMSVLILVIVPEAPVKARARFDFVGAAGLAAGLVLLLLPISKGSDWGWTSGTTLGMFGAAVVVLLLWGWWELRTPAPLIDLRTSARRQVLLTNLASIVIGFAMYAMSLITPQLLQLPAATGYGLGRSMVEAGLWMAPAGLMMMAVSPVAARLSSARGPKTSLLLGTVVIASGYLLALALMGHAWGVLIFSCVVSAGIGFAYAAMPSIIMSAVPLSETAAANGLNSLMRSIGTSCASAVLGALLANMTIKLGPVTLPSEDGFRAGFLFGGAVALVAALIVLTIPGRRAAAHRASSGEPAGAGHEVRAR
ncbi:MFS transporter [Nonomuraea phyllanthi]|uniref:MFS transporter n=1 Tax=Nonomuraea phyllanthi TaxID=2219224 RepID=A0A5C4VS13_9ACTN|nr:MFS transporter [Nonomuraea phyllanthi]KAB8189765.1 MFS transporter [Nonomuraea phyllanthi]QFY08721.1 MFS transporter [Nonomuraea phyllanthi]